MTNVVQEKTTVVVIGAGASGLTVGNMLNTLGIDCIVLEHRSREYVEQRQRAGIVELRAVRMFHRWGLGDVIVGPPYDGTIEVRIDGETNLLTEVRDAEDDPSLPMARFCPQQALVRNLLARLADNGGDMRFEAADVAIAGVDGSQPVVSYTDADGVRHEIACDYIAGCDGDHGVSRTAIPDTVLKSYIEDYDAGWLSVLADVPAPERLLVAISDQGYACQIARGPFACRFYLECPVGDTVENWSDERIWEQVRIRTGNPDIKTGPITEKQMIGLRSCVHEPMSFGKLFLVGDSAHIVVPVTGKGMNLALRDAELLVNALRDMVEKGDSTGLRGYSDACLARVWNYQEFTLWVAEAFHDAGDTGRKGEFKRKLARARLKRMLTTESSARVYGELMAGID